MSTAHSTTFELGLRFGNPRIGETVASLHRADIPLRAVRLRACGDALLPYARSMRAGETPRIGVTQETTAPRLTVSRAAGLDLARGVWCGMDLMFDGAWVLEGTVYRTGGLFEVEMEVPSLSVDADRPFGQPLDETAVMAELGGRNWLAPLEEALLAGDDVALGPDAPQSAEIATALSSPYDATAELGSGLWLTGDADLDLTSSERLAGPIGVFSPSP